VYVSGGGETTTYRTPVLLVLVSRKPGRQRKKKTKGKTHYELNAFLAMNCQYAMKKLSKIVINAIAPYSPSK
jgi:hypothetical protein